MQKVRIRLPATLIGFGPALGGLGLAVSLYCTVEIVQRSDEALVVETEGEGAGRYPLGLRHPVALAMMRVFQSQERAPLGLTISVNNQIPLESGLGAEAAFWTAGFIGASNLLGGVYSRQELIERAARTYGRPDSVVAAVLGGLTAGAWAPDRTLLTCVLPVQPLTLVIALPELPDYAGSARPERVLLADAIANLSQVPLLIDALQSGDLEQLAQTLDDRLLAPALRVRIPGYDEAEAVARRAGAAALALCGGGPALVAFAGANHSRIAAALEIAFENAGVRARTWVVAVDRQGVVVNVARTA